MAGILNYFYELCVFEASRVGIILMYRIFVCHIKSTRCSCLPFLFHASVSQLFCQCNKVKTLIGWMVNLLLKNTSFKCFDFWLEIMYLKIVSVKLM